jgi:cytochrome c551/c552
MVNEIKDRSETHERAPIRLVGFVLLLGTLLAFWGTRDDRHLFGEPSRKPVGVAAELCLPAKIQTGMLDRGSRIEQVQCAGCHDMFTRSTGPSYQEIVTFYRHRSSDRGGAPDLLSRLSAAVAHPQPGWRNFAPAPGQEGLSLEDRVAVASWMLGSFEKTSASEGVRR